MNFLIKNKYEMKTNDLILDGISKDYILMVRDLSEDERPREKLINLGPGELTSAELLAVVMNTGTKHEDVLQMSSRILKDYGNKTIVGQTNAKKLAEELDIPLYKACQIVACFELGKRYLSLRRKGRIIIRNAKQAFYYLREMRDLPKEQLRGLYLNSRYGLVHDEVISIGSLTANVVHPREVFRPAIEHGAVAVILAHNHPSGSVRATLSDRKVTKQLKGAADILGIDFLDHLIIAGNHFSSIEIS